MRKSFVSQIFIILIGIIFFFPFLGAVHLFDWDEINFAEAAREMLVTKEYLRVQIDFLPFWEKPPLFIWLQALSMKVFGINEFAARFPNALAGIATLSALFHIGSSLKNERQGWIWALLYLGSWLPHFYFKTAIIDPIFNLFIFLAFYQIYLSSINTSKTLHFWLTGLFLGAAVLTKGPVAILIALLCLAVYIVWNKGPWGIGIKGLLWISLSTIIFSGSWFLIDILKNGWWFTETFIEYQIRLFSTEDAGHRGPFFYHFIVLILGCFPASIFIWKRRSDLIPHSNQDQFTAWMWILLIVTLLLFSIVKTKIVHYSSLCYFPITYLAAKNLSQLNHISIRTNKIYRILLLSIGSLWSIILIALPILGNHLERLIPIIDDPFAVANLDGAPSFSYALTLLGVINISALIYTFIKASQQPFRTYGAFLILNAVIIGVTMAAYTPKIEAISQRAAIEYFQSFEGDHAYVQPIGYKSYAHLFYTKRPDNHSELYKEHGLQYLLSDKVDRPVYFITKNIYLDHVLNENPQLKVIHEKNGYIFLQKEENNM